MSCTCTRARNYTHVHVNLHKYACLRQLRPRQVRVTFCPNVHETCTRTVATMWYTSELYTRTCTHVTHLHTYFTTICMLLHFWYNHVYTSPHFLAHVTLFHGHNLTKIGVFNTKQVSYVRMRPRGRVTFCDKTRASMVGRRHNCSAGRHKRSDLGLNSQNKSNGPKTAQNK